MRSLLLLLPSLLSAQQIVYTHAPDGAEPWPVSDIYAMNADGSNAAALTNDGHSHDAAWSPTADRILFVHDAEAREKVPYRDAPGYESRHAVELSVMDRDGRNRRVLRRIEPVIYSAAWSPDGKTLAIACIPKVGVPAALYLLDADGKGELRLLFPNAFTPAWSPDSKHLAFVLEQPRGKWSLHVANADGTGETQLTGAEDRSGSPAWSPDGKTIAFDRGTGIFGAEQVFAMNSDGTNMRQLTRDSRWSCTHPSWSPEGKLAVSCHSTENSCGRGMSSVGTPLAPCTRRVFVVSPEIITRTAEHDAAQASFAPAR